MTYYLSKQNEEIAKPILLRLEASLHEEVIAFATNAPEKLAYILRNAINQKQYKHLKPHWSFSPKETKVLAKRKIPLVSSGPAVQMGIGGSENSLRYQESTTEVQPQEMDAAELDQLDIVQLLIAEKPPSITFTNHTLTERDIRKLQKYADNTGYTLSCDTPDTISFRRS